MCFSVASFFTIDIIACTLGAFNHTPNIHTRQSNVSLCLRLCAFLTIQAHAQPFRQDTTTLHEERQVMLPVSV